MEDRHSQQSSPSHILREANQQFFLDHVCGFCEFCVFFCGHVLRCCFVPFLFFGVFLWSFLAIGVLGCGFQYSSVLVQFSMFQCESVQYSLLQYKSVCFSVFRYS